LLILGLRHILDADVIVSSHNSIHWKSRNEVEWLANLEAHVELGGIFLDIFHVKKFPLLVFATSFLPGLDVLAFYIFAIFNFDNSTIFDVGNKGTIHLPNLPPFT